MPSPFPGMDPYLESPAYWRGVHHRLITALATELTRTLPPEFTADIDERLYVVEPARTVYPDVAVFQRRDAPPAAAEGGGGVAMASASESSGLPLLLELTEEEIREPFIEIRELISGRGRGRVVTVIEVLSPANKEPESRGREQYLAKQRDLQRSEVNLLEIDLLRSGAHTVAAPRWRILERRRFDYVISLVRAARPMIAECWPVTVRERLPVLNIPLTPKMPDLRIDLQQLFDWVYEVGPYAREVDYEDDPEPPLAPADAAWADAVLREGGFRPPT